ncbi:hypothetical protein MOC16_gp334 [Klebsiella phage vB_KpM_FBKp24]|uniref:Uncharacterized protein n=1 Tax=Klebsiella phage vB_KpM_FBKp24 TaxID=2801834 RepID=A0A7U0J752_9CAUD|nr:hypothetical protein [Klebsiella pneumoniae]YP_010298716.1 hypothetical protein MOC16_gp334 [Klebsiella phage vB_KpM_FBKp24]QQV92157.1 hypothetical protein vBKpMFBKp24_079 [Klebsiella phage vB_KpM_FBKp24]
MTEKTPELTKVDLTRDLNDVINYSADMLSKISMKEFETNWAPRFFNTEASVQQQALDDWERLIAFGRNKPVFIYNAEGVINWIFPPILGDFQPKYSGGEHSLFSITMEIKTITNRLRKQGEAMSEKIYASLTLDTIDKEMWQRRLHEIRVHCGYPYPGQTSIEPIPGGASTTTTTSLIQPDEYDY